MNFYTLAAKMNRTIAKETDRMSRIERRGYDQDNSDLRQIATQMEMNKFRSNVELGIDLMLIYKDIATEKGLYADKVKKTYFITIRPKCTITFDEFYNNVKQYVDRKCFINYQLTFEQKGTSKETLGEGFHTHIIAHMKQRSKGEVLRDTISAFKHQCEPNCIQVDILKSDSDYKQTLAYITDYTSDDNHKLPTKEWDELWRTNNNLKNIYTDDLPIKSSRQIEISNNPLLLTMD